MADRDQGRAWRARPLSGRRVADIGCSTGRLLHRLTSRGARAVGIDTDPGMLTLAVTRGQVARADAHRLPLADASMDAAVTVATLEFTADPAQVLAEMARITRPGGRLVVAVLNPASLWGTLDRPARRAPYSGGCFLPRASLLALGRRHGKARITGALFAAGHLPARQLLGPALETTGKLIPRFGALQVLTGPRQGRALAGQGVNVPLVYPRWTWAGGAADRPGQECPWPGSAPRGDS